MALGYQRKSLSTVVTPNKGTDILLDLMTSQYASSSNLIEYYSAFISEMDLLYREIENVYFGRFLEYAEGVQLDVIGIIVGQSRFLDITTDYFAFLGVLGADGMADEITPNDGGIFLDENSDGYEITPLSDVVYGRLLKTKALINLMETIDIESAYQVITSILGRAVSTLSIVTTDVKEIELTLSSLEITEAERNIIIYATKYFVPLGTKLTLVMV